MRRRPRNTGGEKNNGNHPLGANRRNEEENPPAREDELHSLPQEAAILNIPRPKSMFRNAGRERDGREPKNHRNLGKIAAGRKRIAGSEESDCHPLKGKTTSDSRMYRVGKNCNGSSLRRCFAQKDWRENGKKEKRRKDFSSSEVTVSCVIYFSNCINDIILTWPSQNLGLTMRLSGWLNSGVALALRDDQSGS